MKKSILLLSVLLSQLTFAQELIFQDASIVGSGCDQASSEVLINEQDLSIHLKLKEFSVLDSGKKLDRKTCALALPIVVPANKRLVIQELKLSGVYSLSKKNSVTVSASPFFTGSLGKSLSQKLGSTRSNSVGELEISEKELAKSACGSSTILRLNSSLLGSAKKLQASEVAQIEQIKLQLRLEDCI